MRRQDNKWWYVLMLLAMAGWVMWVIAVADEGSHNQADFMSLDVRDRIRYEQRIW